MTKEKALRVLKEYQRWRRDSSVPPKWKLPDSKDIGRAIDYVIKILEK